MTKGFDYSRKQANLPMIRAAIFMLALVTLGFIYLMFELMSSPLY